MIPKLPEIAIRLRKGTRHDFTDTLNKPRLGEPFFLVYISAVSDDYHVEGPYVLSTHHLENRQFQSWFERGAVYVPAFDPQDLSFPRLLNPETT